MAFNDGWKTERERTIDPLVIVETSFPSFVLQIIAE